MFMKRPKNDAKFRHSIDCIFNVKRYSLALDKRLHKYLPLFYVAYHAIGAPELKFRIEKLEMHMNELDTRLRHVLGHQRYEYCHQCGKCSSGCPAASFLDFRPRRVLAMGIEAEKLAINLNLSPVGEILKKLEGK